jgi:Holliday junction resolvasome RuvABC endonuclease subunit
LKYKLWQQSIPLDVIQPTRVKKLASGKGNASKQEMFEAFVKETGTDLRIHFDQIGKEVKNPITDIVDSFYICKAVYDNQLIS